MYGTSVPKTRDPQLSQCFIHNINRDNKSNLFSQPTPYDVEMVEKAAFLNFRKLDIMTGTFPLIEDLSPEEYNREFPKELQYTQELVENLCEELVKISDMRNQYLRKVRAPQECCVSDTDLNHYIGNVCTYRKPEVSTAIPKGTSSSETTSVTERGIHGFPNTFWEFMTGL